MYVDEALTGTKDDRDGFQRLLADSRAGKIDMVLTKSISRFARNTVKMCIRDRAKVIRNAARYLTGEAKAGSILTTSNDNRRDVYKRQALIFPLLLSGILAQASS